MTQSHVDAIKYDVIHMTHTSKMGVFFYSGFGTISIIPAAKQQDRTNISQTVQIPSEADARGAVEKLLSGEV